MTFGSSWVMGGCVSTVGLPWRQVCRRSPRADTEPTELHWVWEAWRVIRVEGKASASDSVLLSEEKCWILRRGQEARRSNARTGRSWATAGEYSYAAPAVVGQRELRRAARVTDPAVAARLVRRPRQPMGCVIQVRAI